jgi:hypothetical protein
MARAVGCKGGKPLCGEECVCWNGCVCSCKGPCTEEQMKFILQAGFNRTKANTKVARGISYNPYHVLIHQDSFLNKGCL